MLKIKTYTVIFVTGEYYLNTYFFQLPTDGSNPNLDVLFNIQSGAFLYGWGHKFGPEILMDRDVIWATINYRFVCFFLVRSTKSFIEISKSNYKRILNSV
jgi:hypothetical protein